jgi:Holliday junction resolvase RusA-like endonuclease
VITLVVHGEPAPQGSKSVSRHGGVYEKSRKVKPWREAIRAAALTQADIVGPLAGPVRVDIVFLLARPQGHYRTGRNAGQLRGPAPPYPATRPDLDKLARSTLDGLMLAGLYHDDGQVVRLNVAKRYAAGAIGPGALIEIDRMGL